MREYTNKMLERKEALSEFFERKDYIPVKFKEIAMLFQVPKKERDNLQTIISDLIKEGKIVENGEGKFERPRADIITGTFMSTKKGFGFLRVADNEEDIFIGEENTLNAFDGDTVTARILHVRTGRSREAKIIKIVERGIKTVVGTFERNDNFGFVLPDNPKIGTDIYIPKKECKNVPKGYKVVTEITNYGDFKHSPEGKIIEILGNYEDKGVDILSIVKAYNIEEKFPVDVINDVKKVPQSVTNAELENRLDLRNELIVTIDGVDSKDLDDAISISKVVEEGRTVYNLGVHIADVSHYVKEDGSLDKEALKRATSIYLIDKVIPMLPKELSNGICSLNENEDRLALSCIMKIDEKGEVISHEIRETVIKTTHRMNYPDVNVLIMGNGDNFDKLKKEFADVYKMLLTANELALILRDRRHARGSIDFDFPESKITLDENGRVVSIEAYDRNDATKLIEEFMLIANETIAEDSFWQELPFIYRVHEKPDEEKIRELNIFINNFGYSLKKTGKKKIADDDIHSKDVQKLLKKVEGKKEEMLISRMTLRALKRAKYTPVCGMHFGLAMNYYCHFTSPIRRYPDLQIHRILKENINGELTEKRIAHYKKILDDVAIKSSLLERRADDVERDVDKMKSAEYMLSHIGEEFDGIISKVTSWGIYIELPNTVEGMVRIESLEQDYFEFDAERMEIVGRRTKKSYSLGQFVRIKVVNASKQLKTIDFVIVEGDTYVEG